MSPVNFTIKLHMFLLGFIFAEYQKHDSPADELYHTNEWQQLQEALCKAEEEQLEKEEEEKGRERGGSSENGRASSALLLDSEVSSVLCQFDDIISSLEREAASGGRSASISPAPRSTQTQAEASHSTSGVVDNGVEDLLKAASRRVSHSGVSAEKMFNGGVAHGGSAEESAGRRGRSGSVPLLSVSSDASALRGRDSEEVGLLHPSTDDTTAKRLSVRELRQQFLSPTRARSLSPASSHANSTGVQRDTNLPVHAGNVRSIISKMQQSEPGLQDNRPPSSPQRGIVDHDKAMQHQMT